MEERLWIFGVLVLVFLHFWITKQKTKIWLLPSNLFLFLEVSFQYLVPILIISEPWNEYYLQALLIYFIGILSFFLGYHLNIFGFIRPSILQVALQRYGSYDKLFMKGAKLLCLIGLGSIGLVFFLTGIVPALDPSPGEARFFHFDLTYFRYYKYIYWLGIYSVLLSLTILFSFRIIHKKNDRFSYFCLFAGLIFLGLTTYRGPILGLLLLAYVFYYQLHPKRFSWTLTGFVGLVGVLIVFVSLYYREGSGDIGDWTKNAAEGGSSFVDFYELVQALQLFEGKSYIYGKTYLADLLGVIPHGILDFRDEYRWKEWTKVLFGTDPESGGFRLTPFGEPFFNFGFLGVVLKGMALGGIYSILDCTVFYASKIYNSPNLRLTLTGYLLTYSLINSVVLFIQNTYDFLFALANFATIIFVFVVAIFLKKLSQRDVTLT